MPRALGVNPFFRGFGCPLRVFVCRWKCVCVRQVGFEARTDTWFLWFLLLLMLRGYQGGDVGVFRKSAIIEKSAIDGVFYNGALNKLELRCLSGRLPILFV